ncbi:MAG: PilT/PilU family type 4a pilus ATPase [Ignavibacteria bacterium]|jgi:twitching motility protein PilT|nr:PilT/PilU family type 4a pilus ATPase [Ignavibacteria bacterium]MCU7514257.1 PilT/PilU family type 4a pilus ATPase [Ignavibacteria bacterium]MCU7526000.1 PilT/PilU family type 4a pilus ATPase [Ignavibacteria bacterium]
MLNTTKKILSEFAAKIPNTYFGPDRVLWISENLTLLKNDDKRTLLCMVNHLLTEMIEKNASDIELGGHGTAGFVWFRIFGKKEPAKNLPSFSADEAAVLILSLLNDNQRIKLTSSGNLDFSYTFFHEKKNDNVRFRADAYYDLDCLALNMRAISSNLRPIQSIGFHQGVLKVMSHAYVKQGLTLITGITGSGKSTTLDAIVDWHNQSDPAHVVIIAAPIEFVHKSKACIIRHREVGRDVPTFKEGVIQALRQDPDIIVIGEMRDPDTIMAALEVTDTGHKVFSTLHTSSAVESIDRIIAEVHPSEQERVRNRLADVLVSIVSQKLVPSLDGKRVLAKEVLVVNASVRAAIKNNNTSEIYMMINQGGQQGMLTMEQDLKSLYLARRISLENAMAYANNKQRMQQILAAV